MNRYCSLCVTLFMSLLILTGCASKSMQPVAHKNSQLTHGNVQLSIKKGVTTQSQVLNSFGAPNIKTIDGSGREVWTYQRSAQVNQSSVKQDYWTIFLLGSSGRASGFKSSSNMITLIITFDQDHKVVDFSSRTSSF